MIFLSARSRKILRALVSVSDTSRPSLYECRAIPYDGREPIGNGLSFKNEDDAVIKALAESIERHVWFSMTDFFVDPIVGAYEALSRTYPMISPLRYAGFTPHQRERDPQLTLQNFSSFLWIQGYSWTSQRISWLPAQTVSGAYTRYPIAQGPREPVIRASTTCGVAVAPTRKSAVLAGTLELIERDAFLILWLNQLTLPRIDLESLRTQLPDVDRFLLKCEVHHLICHCVRLLTDAPTYALCIILEDPRGHPRFSFGLRAGNDFETNFVAASLEALRARRTSKNLLSETSPIDDPLSDNYIHLRFWLPSERGATLAFLVSGDIKPFSKSEWDDDNEETHLSRLIAWCRNQKYELASVSLTNSFGNPSPWHIESVVIPELLPYYIRESRPHTHSPRLHAVPKKFGYMPREQPYTYAPHPFG